MAPDTHQWPTSQCSSARCRAPIVWARTEAGKSTPVDLEPYAAGTTDLTHGLDGQPHARVVPAAERAGRTDLHASHWATCPDRGSFKRGR